VGILRPGRLGGVVIFEDGDSGTFGCFNEEDDK
jgi:hypothetical protein